MVQKMMRPAQRFLTVLCSATLLLGATERGELAYGEAEGGKEDERAFTGRPT
jgi:hypothetical protein